MPKHSQEKVTIKVDEITWETEKALLVKKNRLEYWFPLSTVHAIHRTKEPSIVVDYWKAKELGLL